MKRIFLILFLLMLTGCNYKELSNLDIVRCASIDFENNQYVVNYLISNIPKNKDSAVETRIIEGKGRTISEAIKNMNLTNSKELYIGHLSLYVISEEIAKTGINKVTDFFFRNPASKKTFLILIAKNEKAGNILKKISNPDDISDLALNTTLLSLLKNIKDQGIEATINGVVITEGKLKIDSMAIFKGDKLLGWINNERKDNITLLLNQSKNIKKSVDCENGKIVFALNNLKIKKSFKINKKIDFKIKIISNTNIEEMNCDYDTRKISDLKSLENLLIDSLKRELNKTILGIKNNKSDVIGLGNFIYQNDYHNWLKIKNNYLDNINVKFEIIPNLLSEGNSNEGTNKYE